MRIIPDNVWQRYQSEWVIKGFSYSFEESGIYTLVGPNGSGKSTILKLLSGMLTAAKGTLTFTHDNLTLGHEEVALKVSFTSPYMNLPEEMSIKELLPFHLYFRNLVPEVNTADFKEILQLGHAYDKPLHTYSSGMKQRVKLALSILTDSLVLLIDEPATNLDREGVKWFEQTFKKYRNERLSIICANREEEMYGEILNISRWK